MGVIKKFKELLQKVRHKLSRNYCYTEMEYRGIAAFGCCSGLVGGDKLSGYLQYECIDCPYYVNVNKIER